MAAVDVHEQIDVGFYAVDCSGHGWGEEVRGWVSRGGDGLRIPKDIGAGRPEETEVVAVGPVTTV